MKKTEKEIIEVSPIPEQGPVTAIVHEWVKVRKADLEELTTRKEDLEKFFFACVTTFQELEKSKPKSAFDISGMMKAADEHKGKMEEISRMINHIYATHYTVATPETENDNDSI